MALREAGKGSKRRPTDEKKLGKRWCLNDPVCPVCKESKCPKARFKAIACPSNK